MSNKSPEQQQQNYLPDFFVANMKEMEIELRAHSIVLDALAQKIITPEQIAESVDLARRSTAMLAYIEAKYLPYEAATTPEPEVGSSARVERMLQLCKRSDLLH